MLATQILATRPGRWHNSLTFVSIIFGIILLAYVAIRCASWLRGQVRLQLHRRLLPGAPVKLLPPGHLDGPLEQYFEACERLRFELACQLHIVSELLLSDPDITFGQIRDPRYRRALLEAQSSLHNWQATLAELEMRWSSYAGTRARALALSRR